MVLALGSVGWQHGVHGGLLNDARAGGELRHWLFDSILALPLALVAILSSDWLLSRRRPSTQGSSDPVLRLAAICLFFTLLVIPAVAVHGVIEGPVAADAHGMGASPTEGEPQASGDIVSLALHAGRDALLGLPGVAVAASLGLALERRLGKVRSRSRRLVPLKLATSALAIMAVTGGAPAVSDRADGVGSPGVFTEPLEIPPVLSDPDIEIEMAETEVQVLPGAKTRMWTYNGTFPGPTIRRPSGEATNVTFVNKLPSSAGSASVHNHGNHSPSSEDGQPDDFLIPPGGTRTYNYPLIEDGGPERAATQWYHDHRMDVTGRNVWMGLAGFFIIDDEFETALPLPKGEFDVPLMIVDRQFDADNQIPYQFQLDGVTGDTILINGTSKPFFEVGDRQYRFRILNASNVREYDLTLSNGQALTQIGTDSGLLPKPVSRTRALVTPSERLDVVIDFAGLLGETIVLHDRDRFGNRTEIMQFRVTRDLVDESVVPSTLRPLPPLSPTTTERTWTFDSRIIDGHFTWTINGKPFDPDRVDARPRRGTTEKWVLRNDTPATHVVHIHDVDQRAVSRNGRRPPDYERLKESWRLAPGETIEVRLRFTDHLGPYIIHCHVLEHEDMAMMATFEVVP